MANYDDIFNASQSVEADEKSYSSFDKEEWAAQKKQEREDAFALIDTTAEHMANDGALFQSYLDVQAHFDRYSVGNALLITAQRPEATQLADSKSWRENGVYIKKGEVGIVLLEPGEEFTKEDGSVGVSYNSKKVFDISQTDCTDKMRDSYVVTKRPDIELEEIYEYFTNIIGKKYPIKLSSKIATLGYTDGKSIWISKHLDTKDAIPVLFHEYTHAENDFGSERAKTDSGFREWRAEISSWLLCHALSLDNGESAAYVFNHNPDITKAESARRSKSVINFVQKTLDQMKFQDFLYE